MQHLPALEKLACVLESAKCAVKEKRPEAARDSCMQGFALLDLICTENFGFVTQFQTCKTLLDDIIKNLPSSTKEPDNEAVHSIERSTVSGEDATNHQEENELKGADNDEEVRQIAQDGFRAVIGCEVAKSSLLENVVLPLTLASTTFAHVFRGIRSGSGNVLLHGPPGTGKTMLAQATATEARAAFYAVRPSDVLSKYQGESERYLKGVFRQARTHPRAIIFFDEFDSIGTSRGRLEDGGAQSRRLLSELLVQMTLNKQLQQQHNRQTAVTASANSTLGGKSTEPTSGHPSMAPSVGQVVVLAATNRLDDLDEAVIRRFEAKVFVGLPSLAARMLMLRTHMQHVPCALSEEELHRVAQLTADWSGSDIEVLCREAAMGPVRDFAPYRAILQERCSSLLHNTGESSAGASDNWTSNDVGSSILAAGGASSTFVTATVSATVSDEELFTTHAMAARSRSPSSGAALGASNGLGALNQQPAMVSPMLTPIVKEEGKLAGAKRKHSDLSLDAGSSFIDTGAADVTVRAVQYSDFVSAHKNLLQVDEAAFVDT